jgi:hypothetical protein
MIIGVHDLEDVAGGYILGILILLIFIYIDPVIQKLQWDWKKKILYFSIFVILFWILSVIILALIHPSEWENQANGIAQTGGMLLGLAIGIPLENNTLRYSPKNYKTKHRILGGFGAIFITFGCYFLLSLLMEDLPAQFIFRGIRYGLLIIILTIGLPWLMQKIFPKKLNK